MRHYQANSCLQDRAGNRLYTDKAASPNPGRSALHRAVSCLLYLMRRAHEASHLRPARQTLPVFSLHAFASFGKMAN